ncbi:MAG: adenylate/guanylate cyclase domain-containing protein [Leptospiraceae bacterium]|nr:adenylate/guanylate cyclase domain-containing protein [Leptospiraceae bacterium]MCB1303475.1 adenylate/guanylate cyclase domain-containing protein [Leptospiraceae bacterium]
MLALFKKYVPAFVLNRLATNPAPPQKPYSENFQAAALFADIAQFTIVTDKIMNQSRTGLLELASIINRYLGRQIEIIDEYGGDIFKFAGDAVFAVWKAEDPADLAEKTLLTVQCALAIQKELSRFPIAKDIEVSLRIGIGAGPMTALSLGGLFERWEILVAGDTVRQTALAEKEAEPGTVVIHPRAWKLLEKRGLGGKVSSSKFLLKSAPPQLGSIRETSRIAAIEERAEEALRCYIPRSIVTIVGTDEKPTALEEQFAERIVSVLFINIQDWSLSFPLERLHRILQIVQGCLYRYEGSINRFGIEDKGSVILAAFGLPPLFHGDDPLRAMYAARDIVRELGELGHRATTGVATGLVFCGPMGNDIRSEYTMHGNVVNLAARLMQASDGVYCDAASYYLMEDLHFQPAPESHDRAIHAASREQLRFQPLDPMQVKGRKDPVKVYRMTWAH